MKLLYVFDLDGTIIDTNTSMIDTINKVCDSNITKQHLKTYDIDDVLQNIECNNLTAKQLFTEGYGLDIIRTGQTVKGAVEYVNQLKSLGHEIIFLTARSLDKYELTKKDLVERGFPEDIPLYFSKSVEEGARKSVADAKLYFLKKTYPQSNLNFIVFEDRPDTLLAMKDEGMITIKVEQEYNKNIALPSIKDFSDQAELNKIIQNKLTGKIMDKFYTEN